MKARCIKTLEGVKGDRIVKFFTNGNRYEVISKEPNKATLMDNKESLHVVFDGEDGWMQYFKFPNA